VRRPETYRHFDFIENTIGDNFDDAVNILLNDISKYFNDNSEIPTYDAEGGQKYKLLHIKEYFSKTLNQSLDRNINYYAGIEQYINQNLDYYAWVAIIRRYVSQRNLFFHADKISNNIESPPVTANITSSIFVI
jgi:uncharacterized protein YbgA (DUF1722 family)